VTTAFLSGASCVAAAVIALFFLRFWRDTHDRLFLLFGLAFAVFAVNRLLLTLIDDDSEGATLVYVLRALAFAMIAAAIVDKNRGAARR
jgi:uncharacterized membrane protein HdeD (DUF308 family)